LSVTSPWSGEVEEKCKRLLPCKRLLEKGCIVHQTGNGCQIKLGEDEFCIYEFTKENIDKLKEWVSELDYLRRELQRERKTMKWEE